MSKENETKKYIEQIKVNGVDYPLWAANGGGGDALFGDGTPTSGQAKKAEDLIAPAVKFKTGENVKDVDYPSGYTKAEIDALVDSVKLPVNSVVIAAAAPGYGTWSDLGAIADGQSIIGGSSTNGMHNRHHHRSITKVIGTVSAKGSQSYDVIASITAFDTNNGPLDIAPGGVQATHTKTVDAYTSWDGTDEKNRAWGLGIGSGMHVWKRTA